MTNSRQSNLAFVLGFAVLALALALNGYFYYKSTARLVANESAVNQSHEVLRASEQLISLMKDAETGQRGYIITGEPEYLEPYLTAKGGLSDPIKKLRELLKDNLEQLHRLDQITPIVNAKIAELDESIKLRRELGENAARRLVKTDRGRVLMDQLRELVAAMNQEELALLDNR
ncbi:MAG: hypothetical protein QOD84_1347, partial [Acidobacteriaceae bacterium]